MLRLLQNTQIQILADIWRATCDVWHVMCDMWRARLEHENKLKISCQHHKNVVRSIETSDFGAQGDHHLGLLDSRCERSDLIVSLLFITSSETINLTSACVFCNRLLFTSKGRINAQKMHPCRTILAERWNQHWNWNWNTWITPESRIARPDDEQVVMFDDYLPKTKWAPFQSRYFSSSFINKAMQKVPTPVPQTATPVASARFFSK